MYMYDIKICNYYTIRINATSYCVEIIFKNIYKNITINEFYLYEII